MVQPRYRSRTHRRVSKRTPGGRTVTHFVRRRPSKAVCATCGVVLAGVPNERPHKIENLAKTKKRPERPFGGVLCSSCAQRKIIKQSREMALGAQ